MAFLIDTIDSSGLFAQSANSATIATKDSNGNDITATYLTGVDLTPYQTTADMVNYQTTADMSAYATTGDVANKLDTSAFSDVSGTFLTAHQPISAEEWNETYETVQTNSANWHSPTYDYTEDNLISAIDASGLFAQGLLSGSHIGRNIVWDGGMGTSNTSQMWLNPEQSHFGITSGIFSPLTYATGATITYGSSGSPAPNDGQIFGGFFKGNEWFVSNATAGQALRGETHNSRGVHLSGSTTAGNSFDLSITGVSGKNSTAHNYNWKLERGCVSGNGVNGEWRYGPDEYSAVKEISGKQPSGDYYSASNPSGFISSVPDTYLQNTDLSVTDGKITGISGIPISAGGSSEISSYDLSAGNGINIVKDDANSAIGVEVTSFNLYSTQHSAAFDGAGITFDDWPYGNQRLLNSTAIDNWNNVYGTVQSNSAAWSSGGEVPSGVMAESGLEYNAVNEISGYNGSAIAQYGAEKQWLQHDDTIVHVANSAQYAFGVNLSAVAQLLGVDETVLYSGTQTWSAALSESVKNFNKILIEYGPNNYYNIAPALYYTEGFTDNSVYNGVHLEYVEHNGANAYCFPKITTFTWHNNFTHLDAVGGLQYRVSGNAIQNESTGNQLYIRKIIGIGRKN